MKEINFIFEDKLALEHQLQIIAAFEDKFKSFVIIEPSHKIEYASLYLTLAVLKGDISFMKEALIKLEGLWGKEGIGTIGHWLKNFFLKNFPASKLSYEQIKIIWDELEYPPQSF